jgi:hypothetical protein
VHRIFERGRARASGSAWERVPDRMISTVRCLRTCAAVSWRIRRKMCGGILGCTTARRAPRGRHPSDRPSPTAARNSPILLASTERRVRRVPLTQGNRAEAIDEAPSRSKTARIAEPSSRDGNLGDRPRRHQPASARPKHVDSRAPRMLTKYDCLVLMTASRMTCGRPSRGVFGLSPRQDGGHEPRRCRERPGDAADRYIRNCITGSDWGNSSSDMYKRMLSAGAHGDVPGALSGSGLRRPTHNVLDIPTRAVSPRLAVSVWIDELVKDSVPRMPQCRSAR